MARLKHKNTRPPRGFRYVQPETRLGLDGDNYNELMKKVLAHRLYKNLARATLPEVQEDVERQICSRLSKNECHSEGPNDDLRPVEETAVLTLSSAMRFTGAAIKWLASGAKVVEMDHLKRRQGKCLNCPINQPLKACSCSGFYKAINAVVPEARRDPGLHICGACGCSINAKVQMPLKMVMDSDEGRNIKYPKFGCWVTDEVEAEGAVKPQDKP